jgi:hypothetical protein
MAYYSISEPEENKMQFYLLACLTEKCPSAYSPDAPRAKSKPISVNNSILDRMSKKISRYCSFKKTAMWDGFVLFCCYRWFQVPVDIVSIVEKFPIQLWNCSGACFLCSLASSDIIDIPVDWTSQMRLQRTKLKVFTRAVDHFRYAAN